jgi:hypothetical protein
MWLHFMNLCGRAWAKVLVALSTSTLSIVLFYLFLPFLVYFGFVVIAFFRRKRNPRVDAPSIWNESFLPTVLLTGFTILILGVLFTHSVVSVLYNDHQGLVSKSGFDRLEIDRLKALTNSLNEQLSNISKRKPPLKDQCWIQNISIPPPKSVAAVSSNETVVYCNYTISAPLTIVVEYDQNPILAGGFAFPSERIQDSQIYFAENKLFGRFNSPSIKPYQLFIATVHGDKDKPPSATKVTIAHIDPSR